MIKLLLQIVRIKQHLHISPNLLLLACSNRKLEDTDKIPAIDRYDGGSYRVLRKAKREGYFPSNLKIYIVSAKYGLIRSDKLIPYYDLRMNKSRAQELKPQVDQIAQLEILPTRYTNVYIDMGGDYLPAIDGIFDDISADKVQYAKGRIGQRLKALKQWLANLNHS